MIEIIEERKEPDLSTEEKKVSEEINNEEVAQKEAAESEAKAADGNEEKSPDPEAAVTEEKAESSEEANKNAAPENSESGDSAEKTEAEEASGNADGKPEAREVSEEPEATDKTEATHETEKGGEEPDMLFGSRKLKKEIEKKDELIKEQNEKYIRLMAEFDNYRKRTEKEKAGMYAMGAKDVVEKILPVVDNFERGFSLVAEEDAEDPFTEGMQKIYKQLMTTLTDLGVTPIEAVGKEFDPNLHNAVMHVDDESVGENIVVQEFQKGYMYKDSVVRHSMVQVAN